MTMCDCNSNVMARPLSLSHPLFSGQLIFHIFFASCNYFRNALGSFCVVLSIVTRMPGGDSHSKPLIGYILLMMFRRDWADFSPESQSQMGCHSMLSLVDCPRSLAIIYVNSGRCIDVIYVAFLSSPLFQAVYCKNN